MATTQTALQRCMGSIRCETDKFCCCSLRAGVLVLSVIYTVNAGLAFAFQAALYLGVLNAVSGYLPPGTKLDDPSLRTVTTVLGLWTLSGAICGFLSACRRDVRAATGFYVINLIDLVLAVLIAVYSLFMGVSINIILGQIPDLILNAYVVIVVRSWRMQLVREQKGSAGGIGEVVNGLPPADESGLGASDELDVDDLDIDLEAPAPAVSQSGASKAGHGGPGPGSQVRQAKAAEDDD